MKDKSLGIWLIVTFGISGIAVILLGWLLPSLESERITATIAGSAGLIVAIIQALILRQSPTNINDRPSTVKVEVAEKS